MNGKPLWFSPLTIWFLYISIPSGRESAIKEISFATATRIALDVKENDIVIFPSKTPHSTDQIKTNSERISISGDVIFVAKDTTNIEHLMPNFKNWRRL